ncbi:caspase family protein [Aliarcobacter cryaerophilus]|uniref:caspase family protein n=1 Tax=Aliarcobacter cryaerophilus TaxID=28198 RepID=UPI0021B2085E|nr:caspase family protein [Aliarcobacter cryaerophilus]MCT7514226.1 caspase family protein [Aliarcobacter cryaerophilus]
MTKKALLIGNSGTDDDLKGVSMDINKYSNFLKSIHGGAWENGEIIISLNENIDKLKSTIQSLKNESNDFLFILFSGHGSYSQKEQTRKLYIFNDYILEKDLLALSSKQITIIDSCAEIEFDLESLNEDITVESGLNSDSYKEIYRQTYESLIKECPKQQAILYSSSIDNLSYDTVSGGLFSNTLLNYSKKSNKNLNIKEAFTLANNAILHSNSNQTPDCLFIKSTNILPFYLK